MFKSPRGLLGAGVSMIVCAAALAGGALFGEGDGARRCDEAGRSRPKGGEAFAGGDFDDYMQALDDLHEAEAAGGLEPSTAREQLDELAPRMVAPDQPSGVPALASAKPVMSL